MLAAANLALRLPESDLLADTFSWCAGLSCSSVVTLLGLASALVLCMLVVFADFGCDGIMHSEVSPILSRCHEVHYCGVCHSIRCSTPAVSGSLFRLLHGGVLQRQREARTNHL